MKNERILWLDLAKLFGIFLIVFGHMSLYSGSLKWLNTYVYSFHVPLFFMLSGYLFNKYKDYSFLKFLKKKSVTFLIPYFVFSILFLIIYLVLGSSVAETLNKQINFSLSNLFLGILYATGDKLPQNAPLWFLPCLFVVEVLYFLISKFCKNNKVLLTFICVSLCFLFLYIKFPLFPWSLNSAFIMLLYFHLGNLKIPILKNNMNNKIFVAVLLIFGFLLQFQNKINISVMTNYYGNQLIFLSSSVLTIMGYYLLFKSLSLAGNWISKLSSIGKNTLGILIFHKLFVILFQTKMGLITNLLNNGNVIISLIVALIATIVTILICSAITIFINKYFSFLLGNVSSIHIRREKS